MALHYAIRNKLLVEIRFLVENGADVNARDRNRRTPLMLCCVEDDEKFAAGIARMLLQAGAKVGLVDKDGRNSLMVAALFGRAELTELFVRAVDFTLNLKDRFGNSALHFAALKGNAGIVKTLLEVISRTGSEINSRNRIGQTPAAIALQEGHISLVELFKKTSKVDFDTKVPSVLLMRPWSSDLKYIEKPSLMLKEAEKEAVLGADVHKSRPDFNIHQFRRAGRILEDQSLKKKQRKLSGRLISNTSSPSTRPFVRVTSRSAGFLPDEQNTSALLLNNRLAPKNPSWKIIMSDMLDTLRVQVSESYRKPAIVVPQTIEEVFKPPEPLLIQPDAEDAISTEKALGGQENRRKSAQGLMKTKKSDLYDLCITTENKKKNRRYSLQPGDVASQLQRKKTLSKFI